MVKMVARGWSTIRTKSPCTSCQKGTDQVIIQYQNKVNLGPITLWGKGVRGFGKECTVCHTIGQLTKKQLLAAENSKYYDKRVNTGISTRVGRSSLVQYPILDEKRRKEIRKSNIKEGWMSSGIGLVIGIIIMPFWEYGIFIGLLFVLTGLYAALEDPERKHRDLIRNKKII